MPRTLSAQAIAAATARETGVIMLQTLDVNLGNGTTLYVVNNPENISVNSQEYDCRGFQFDPPEETEDGFSSARVNIDNTDQVFTPYLRNLFGPIRATFRVVSQTDLTATPAEFDNVEFLSRPLELRNVSYNGVTVTGTLVYHDTLKSRYPAGSFSQQGFPGLF
jgi:hypothetical protein